MPTTKPSDFATQCANAAAIITRESLTHQYNHMHPRCESPIEKMMLASILLVLDDIGHPFLRWNLYGLDFSWPGKSVIPTDNVTLFCQAVIGKYRADFLLGIWALGEHRAIVIECDGHDYHERTKAQACRDRKRDRWMTINDVVVLRFTGSEIHADSLDCAKQIGQQFDKTYNSMGSGS